MKQKLRVLDLFSGIGGFSLGLERTGGFETVAFCEIEPFPRRVLAKHWPEVPCYDDVRTLTAKRLAADGIAVDVITGGFPCQDISTAGNQAGINSGTRSGLWSEIVRLASELRPQFIIVENVANLLAGPSDKPGGWFGRVLGDLAECGYDAEWENIPAAAVGAPHRRERVWIIAHPKRVGLEAQPNEARICHEAIALRYARRLSEVGGTEQWFSPRPLGVIPVELGYGVSNELGAIKAYGNSVVPQIPELIGNAILDSIGWRESEAA
jgi:DNA (cytosine-5)-methyltransferase 1